MPTNPSTTFDESPRPKDALFCPDCGHESGVDGDWCVRDEGESRVYDCPECGTTIIRRDDARPLLCP
ncbi:MAG: hypothetical protein ABEJ68_05355 [Halobacteriaceae archaeon]